MSLDNIIYKYKKLPITAKASIVYLIMSLIQKGLSFITSPIFIRMMTSEEYGQMSIFYTDSQLIGTIAMFCLGAGCFDVGIQENKNNKYDFMFSIMILSNCITLVTGLVLFVSFPWIGTYLKISRFLLMIMFVEFMVQPALTYWTRAERYVYKYLLPSLVTIFGAINSVCLSILAVSNSNNKVEAKIVAGIFAMMPIYLFFWIYIGIKANFKINIHYIKFAFFFNLPLILHYLSGFVLNSSDRLMIANICGTSETAYYSLAYNVASIVSIVWTAINSSLIPYVFEKYEKKEYKTVSNNVLKILTMFAGICLMFIMMAPEVVKIMGTEEYYNAIFVIPPVVGGIFFQALYYLFTNILYYLKKPKVVMIASSLSAISNILLNYIYINKYGYIAAGYTTLGCFLIQAIFDYLVVRKLVGFDIYDMKYISALSIIVILISIISNFLYNYTIVRFIVVGILVFVLCTNKSILLKKEYK